MTTIQLPLAAKGFFSYQQFSQTQGDILLLCHDEETAVKYAKQLKFFAPSISVKFLPSWDTLPYDRLSPNQQLLAERVRILTSLAQDLRSKKIIVTNVTNLINKLPTPEILTNSSMLIQIGMKLNPKEFINFLINNGFVRSSSANVSGEFATRGEIIDVVINEYKGYRINFSWDKIESIRQFDVDTQLSHSKINELFLTPASEIILNNYTVKNFKNNFLKFFGVNHTNYPLYEAILEGNKFPAYEQLLPLYYEQLTSLIQYLIKPTIIYDNLVLQAILEYEHSFSDFYQSRLQANKINNSFYPALPPNEFCLTNEEIRQTLSQKDNVMIEAANSQEVILLQNLAASSFAEQKTIFEKLSEVITHHKDKISIVFCSSTSSLERVKTLAQNHNYIILEINNLSEARPGLLNLAKIPFLYSYYTKDYLFIAEQDLFGKKLTTSSITKSKSRLKNILTELDNLSEGELVVHKDHGIGKFAGIETLEVSGKRHDCLKILYADDDKLYIPVENIEVIKKYGSDEASLDKLGGVSWQRRRAKLKGRITEIAEKLIQITAERKLAKSEMLHFDTALYDKFCTKFNFTETEDQLSAIEDIKSDFTSGQLSDRLICGDVGFGKTEVAMRAAFLVATSIASDLAQVAIVVPTTILCKQHYLRFLERFDGFGLKIAQLSRLVNASETRRVKELIKNGGANIVIGTHAMLAKDVVFKNLKLLIIDEEQHFGVSQKERLKELKAGVHVLSLSATPIPRTLQMSMVGIKDLSLIATPPIDRLAVKTTIMPFDTVIIRDALLRERFRGGRSFYVCPRIKDIEELEKKLQEIVPELRYKVAHGQMPASIIDQIMGEFYEGKFDILLSTSIIESGIDISSANTIIIHKADMFGLSQLYQLRGRVGRGKVRGYAYLTIASNKISTKHAIKRLEIMQTVDSLGAGFTIASHDMDLRGFGNLVGEEQSGHIREVGVELYQEMLEAAMQSLQNKVPDIEDEFAPTINLGLPIYIPDDYIADSSLRLGIYRRTANLLTIEDIENFKDEMIDRFGSLPIEFTNLLSIVKIKQLCKISNIENLDAGPSGFVAKFRKNFDATKLLINFANKYPRHAKIKPDNKLVFIRDLATKDIIEEASSFLETLQLMFG